MYTCTLSGYSDIFTCVDTEVYIICVNLIHTDIIIVNNSTDILHWMFKVDVGLW